MLPYLLVQQIEAGDDAGNVGDGRSVRRRAAAGRREQLRVVRRRAARRHVLVFDDDGLGHALEKQNRLAVAAEARRFRLDDAERERRRDAGIDDVAAAREHVGAGLRRERIAGRHDAARRSRRPA